MRHPALLTREGTALVLIDLQEGYRTALYAWDTVLAACRRLVRGASLLGVPILVTEQYPRGLGHTAPEVMAELPPGSAPAALPVGSEGAAVRPAKIAGKAGVTSSPGDCTSPRRRRCVGLTGSSLMASANP